MTYYGTRLSENISRRDPEGYLLCLNVPVARTGIQEYMPEELGLPHVPEPVPVSRPETEVFAPETIASFEGMPVTNNHPPDGVTIDNIRALQKGHAHNVRRGTGEESDLLLADLIITDPGLIDAILAGKREISCGYTYELHEEDGQYVQRKIRGNHVAVVDAGRAGPRVSIKDDALPSKSSIWETGAMLQPPALQRGLRRSQKPTERSHPVMKKSLLKKLTRMARDGDPEAIEALAEAVEEIIEIPSEEAAVIAAVTEPDPAPAAADPEPEVEPETETVAVTVDSDGIAAILERLDRLIALVTPAAVDEEPAAEEALPEELAEVVEEALEAVEETAGEPAAEEAAEEVAAVIEEVLSEETASVLEPEGTADECDDPDSRCTADALSAAMKAVRPMLVRMSKDDRRRVAAGIAARLRRKSAGHDHLLATLKDARPRPAAPSEADLGKRIMAKRNPNYKE